MCVREPAPLVPRHSWLGCAVWVCVLWLGFRLRPATPGWGVGVCLCLCVCSARTLPLLAGVCGVGVCAWAWVWAAPRHSWLGCWAVCLFVCPLRLYPATPGWGVRCRFVCSGFGFRLRPATPGRVVGVCLCFCARYACTPPLLAGVSGVCVSVWARASAAPRHSWLGGWVCVCLYARSACTPLHLAGACGVCVFVCTRASAAPSHSWLGCWVCVCSCARSACTPSLLAGSCGVGVCVWARVSAPPRHFWLGSWGVCVFLCPLRLYPATPGWSVRFWLCVLALGFRLRLATPGWGVRVCVCLCVRSACTPSHLAGLCGVGVCAWARVSAPPRHFWLGSWGVCVFVCALRLYPATPGWGVRRGCVCFGSGFGCAPPVLTGVLGCVCVCVSALLVPCHSWLGCAVWVRLLGLRFRLRPATPGWGVGVCVCSCARSACTPSLLAGVCGVGVCIWAPV